MKLKYIFMCLLYNIHPITGGHIPSSPGRKSKHHNSLELYSIIGSGAHKKIVIPSLNQPWTGK